MLGQIISGKVAATVLAGAVATSGAVALGSTTSDRYEADTLFAPTVAITTLSADRQNGPALENDKCGGKAHGAMISALAKSIPGGPGKGAIISAAAKSCGSGTGAVAGKKAKPAKNDKSKNDKSQGKQRRPAQGTQP